MKGKTIRSINPTKEFLQASNMNCTTLDLSFY